MYEIVLSHRKKEILPFVAKRMALEGIVLSEMRKRNCVIPFASGLLGKRSDSWTQRADGRLPGAGVGEAGDAGPGGRVVRRRDE